VFPALSSNDPTAVQDVLDVQETPASLVASDLPGITGVWVAQRLPSHRSTRGTSTLLTLWKEPTAVQASLDVHDTATNDP
jgi:hypothetical protein